MRSNKDRKLNLGTAFRLTIRNQFVKKNLDVKIHKLCNLADTEEIQCHPARSETQPTRSGAQPAGPLAQPAGPGMWLKIKRYLYYLTGKYSQIRNRLFQE